MFEQQSRTFKWTAGGVAFSRAAVGACDESTEATGNAGARQDFHLAASFNCGSPAKYASSGVRLCRLEAAGSARAS
jgi:hypothetical protein